MDTAKQATSPERSAGIVAITRHGVGLALHLQAGMPGSTCYVPSRHRFALSMGAEGFDRLSDVIPAIWKKHRDIICIMATGIVVRLIAPLLRHKTEDPAVVVLDEKGLFAISLVSGHLGGANRLAREVARLSGGQAVITTASDVQKKPALDMIAREAGLDIENIGMLSRITRSVLECEDVWVYDPDGRLGSQLDSVETVCRLQEKDVFPADGPSPQMETAEIVSGVGIWVSERISPASLQCLLLRPRNLVVGIGCNRGTSAGEISEFLYEVFSRESLSTLSIKNLASIDLKSDEAGIHEAAKMLGRPVDFYPREETERVIVPHPSDVVAAHIGVKSVCEATALLGVGSGKLIVPKQKTPNVTLAVARADFPS